MFKFCNYCRQKKRESTFNDRPCPIDSCGHMARCDTSLKNHIKAVHNNIRDQRCTFDRCTFITAHQGSLASHIKSCHERILDFKCKTCTYASSSHGNLSRHEKRCTGESPMSGGESAVCKVLEMMNIPFEQEWRFTNCRYVLPLPFDFYLPDHSAVIEYDGEQHFKPISFWGGQKYFESLQRNDLIKNEYCAANGIHILRIKWKDFEEIPRLVADFVAQHPNPSQNTQSSVVPCVSPTYTANGTSDTTSSTNSVLDATPAILPQIFDPQA